MSKTQIPESLHEKIQAIIDRNDGVELHQIPEADVEALGRIYYEFWEGERGHTLEWSAIKCRTCGARRTRVVGFFRRHFPAVPAYTEEDMTPQPHLLEIPEPVETLENSEPIETAQDDEADQPRTADKKPRKKG